MKLGNLSMNFSLFVSVWEEELAYIISVGSEGNSIWKPKPCRRRKRRCVSCYIKGTVSLKRRGGIVTNWKGGKRNLCSMVSFCSKKDANIVFLLANFHFIFHDAKIWVYNHMHLEHFQKQIVFDWSSKERKKLLVE